MQKITPFLWFDGNAETAMNYYVSIFKNSQVLNVSRQGPEGPVFSVTFNLDGQEFHGLNAGPLFKFNEAISFFINCDTQEEVDELWEKLSDGGEKSMCGWVKDKFGLWWQVVPHQLGKLLQDKDPVKSKRVMDAMLKMNKIEIDVLQKAYNQN